MKQLTKTGSFKAFVALLYFIFIQTAIRAQDSTSTSTTTKVTTEQHNWYASPWVWVAGAAVFILLLVALLRGNSNKTSGTTDKVTVTKTVSRDTDS